MPVRGSGTSPLRRGAGFRCHRRTLGHSAATGHRSNYRHPCPQTKPGTFGGRVPPSCCPQPGAGPGQQTQARRLVPEYNFGPAPYAALGRLAQSAFLGSHELSGRIDVAADRKRHHAATGGGMGGESTNAVLRQHQLRHVPFLGESSTVSAARTRQEQTHRSAHRGPGVAGLLVFSFPSFLADLRVLGKRIAHSHEPGWRGKPYTPERIQNNLDTIISGQYVADFLWGKVTRKHRRLGIAFGTDDDAYQKLKKRVLGKRILFTDRTDLTDEEIIFGYRVQHHVKRAFRAMKDPYFISFSPPHH